MFEPSRLAREHLADAYAQVAPVRARPAGRVEAEARAALTDTATRARRQS